MGGMTKDSLNFLSFSQLSKTKARSLGSMVDAMHPWSQLMTTYVLCDATLQLFHKEMESVSSPLESLHILWSEARSEISVCPFLAKVSRGFLSFYLPSWNFSLSQGTSLG